MTVDAPPQFVDLDLISAVDDGGAADRVSAELARLDLMPNARELDEAGYTVLTPAQAAPHGFVDQLRDRVLDCSEAASGVRPDLLSGASHAEFRTKLGRSEILSDVLFSDAIFEQVLMTPSVLALVTHLLGESCQLLAMNGVIKAPGPECVPMHTDTIQPEPLPPYAQIANATWLLTDYDVEHGGTCFLPGSHKECRNPRSAETSDMSAVVPLVAPAGSVVIWHGNTWHGALGRKVPGLRVSLLTIFGRTYLRPPPETFGARVSQAMLDRHPERFARLLGMKSIDLATHYASRHSIFV
ncbi:MAG: phytanoyl-CoA dioxygenase family protein [Novosphingobium sp.]|nr:phytanoyl-CoA dioxygenase family protein [Novosphingobium sp.]